MLILRPPRRGLREPGRRRSLRAVAERMEDRALLSTYPVTNTNDDGPGSLRRAIELANAHPGADQIGFNIPASTAPLLDVPVPGFDPITQTWRITPQTPLPAITDPVTLDAYTQAHAPIPYRYPQAISQVLSLSGGPTGGSFTLTTQAPLPNRTTDPIPIRRQRGAGAGGPDRHSRHRQRVRLRRPGPAQQRDHHPVHR